MIKRSRFSGAQGELGCLYVIYKKGKEKEWIRRLEGSNGITEAKAGGNDEVRESFIAANVTERERT